jgi:hypothetical protein
MRGAYSSFEQIKAVYKTSNSIQFNSIRVYLRANLTAQRPISKLAREQRKTQI